MLNISPNSISDQVDLSPRKAYQRAFSRKSGRTLLKLCLVFLGAFLIILFLPWTQNIRSTGKVTTLNPEQHPQQVHSVIAGQIQDWKVEQGEEVQAGDTILMLREVKNDYFDPALLTRVQEQVKAKKTEKQALEEKVQALDRKIVALEREQTLKRKQVANQLKGARLAFKSDSMKAIASNILYKISKRQFERNKKLEKSGVRSGTEKENQRLQMEKNKAERAAANNQMIATKNDWFNARIERERIRTSYDSKIEKARSDRSAALAKKKEVEAKLEQLKNRLANLKVRQERRAVTAPQDGLVNRTIKSGLGETVKKGEAVAEIVPKNPRFAVRMKLRPMDLPLVDKGQHVRIQFDGWPAVVFSGWPNVSYGTFGGEVVAVNQVPDKQGQYSVLVRPEPEGKDWPKQLGIGGGTDNMILLDDVPIWYELWRRINGFPPNFYTEGDQEAPSKKGKSGSGH